MCNTYCSSAATMVAGTLLDVMLYVDYLTRYIRALCCFLVEFPKFLHHIRAADCTVVFPVTAFHPNPTDTHIVHLRVLQNTDTRKLSTLLDRLLSNYKKKNSWIIRHLTQTPASKLNNDTADSHTEPHSRKPLHCTAFDFFQLM